MYVLALAPLFAIRRYRMSCADNAPCRPRPLAYDRHFLGKGNTAPPPLPDRPFDPSARQKGDGGRRRDAETQRTNERRRGRNRRYSDTEGTGEQGTRKGAGEREGMLRSARADIVPFTGRVCPSWVAAALRGTSAQRHHPCPTVIPCRCGPHPGAHAPPTAQGTPASQGEGLRCRGERRHGETLTPGSLTFATPAPNSGGGGRAAIGTIVVA